MTDKINPAFANLIATRLEININAVQRTIALLDDGATVPFIARYRKEATGALLETQIQAIKECLESLSDLAKRKETIISTIEAQNRLTDELKNQIDNCWDSTQLEDIYLPYKPKRRTRADIARQKGLEPLAKLIMAQNNANIEQNALRYVNDDVPSTDEAIQGAKDIIADWVS